ncbi:MAG: C25 family cysteine peptidase [Candidatus Hodarchaeota archaeon]
MEEKNTKKRNSEIENIEANVKVNKNEIRVKKGKKFATVALGKGFYQDEPGSPALPWKRILISVPNGSVFQKLEILDVKTTELEKKVMIAPCQPNVPTLLGTRVKYVPPNPQIYDSELIWPESFVRFVKIHKIGGYTIAEIEICPFRYHLNNKRLELIEAVDLGLKVERTVMKAKGSQIPRIAKHNKKYLEKVKRMVINPIFLQAPFDDLEVQHVYMGPQEFDYVVITSNELKPSFQPLVSWRTRMGLQATIVTIEDIVNNSVPHTGGAIFFHDSGYADGGTRDAQEAVRNFIKWANVNWLVDYVLIGGDTEVIPCRKGFNPLVGTIPEGDITIVDVDNPVYYRPNASSEKDSATRAYNVRYDDLTQVWECDPGDASPNLTLDLDPHTPIMRIELTWSVRATAYDVQISNDNGLNWTTQFSTAASQDDVKVIEFNCASADKVRIKINSGVNFSLALVRIYGPKRGNYKYNTGYVYRIDNTTMRIYLRRWMNFNPTNSAEENLILIKEGPDAGKVIPYDENSDDLTLGWHFIDDLLADPPNIVSSGDPSSMPTSFIEIRGPSDYLDQQIVSKIELNSIPTDLYYSDISPLQYPDDPSIDYHDWDKDGNEVYGHWSTEDLDEVDGMADIFIGRAPVENSIEAEIFVNKVISYEKFQKIDGSGDLLPMNFAISVLLASQNFGTVDVVDSLDTSAQGQENVYDVFTDFDPNRWDIIRLYEDFDDVSAENLDANLAAATKNDIMNAIRDGRNVLSLSSHGNFGYLCYLITDDIDDIENHPGILYANACSTNMFDTGFGEAFSEWSIINNVGGAVAYVGNSRYGWTGEGDIMVEFWTRLLDSDRLGDMYNACKLVFSGWNSYSLNLLGDPAMRVWSDKPSQIDVFHPSTICEAAREISVRVSNEEGPVENALVCITDLMGGIKTGLTDDTGSVTIEIIVFSRFRSIRYHEELCIFPVTGSIYEPNELIGNLDITVSGKNLIPYEGSIEVRYCPDVCKEAVSCAKLISCGRNIMCGKIITCGRGITCGKGIICGNAIICTSLINCSNLITCNNRIICTKSIGVPPIDCKAFIGCQQLLNIDPEVFGNIHEIFGISNIDDIPKLVDAPEFQEIMDRLPEEIRKPIRMMLKRIMEEKEVGKK